MNIKKILSFTTLILFCFLAIGKTQSIEDKKKKAESELIKTMDSVSELFKKYELLRNQGMQDYVNLFDQEDKSLLTSRFITHDLILVHTMVEVPKEIRNFISKGETGSILELLRLYAAHGNMLAGDYLALAGAEKSFDEKKIKRVASQKDLIKIYHLLSAGLFEYEAACQRYTGLISIK